MFKRIGRPPKNEPAGQGVTIVQQPVPQPSVMTNQQVSNAVEQEEQVQDAWELYDYPVQSEIRFRHHSGKVLTLHEAICELLNRTEE